MFKDPNLPTALTIRERFPTPAMLATASLAALQEARGNTRSLTDTKLAELQRLASQSIGVRDSARQRSLVFEQAQVVTELRLIQEHLQQLEIEIGQIVEQCQEGQILLSIPGVNPLPAAIIMATIGNIANFDSAAALKSYLGWAPTRTQTGTSYDQNKLSHRGVRPAKQIMYLIVWCAVWRKESEWAALYERLVPRMCPYDEKTRSFKGKGKVIGRIAGQMIAMFYALLMADYEAIHHLPSGATIPPHNCMTRKFIGAIEPANINRLNRASTSQCSFSSFHESNLVPSLVSTRRAKITACLLRLHKH